MINRVAHYLTRYIMIQGKIEESEYPVYHYGFVLFIEMFIVILACILIGCCGGKRTFLHGMLFLAMFVPLRRYGGGIHMGKFQNCFLLSVIVYGIVIWGEKYIPRGSGSLYLNYTLICISLYLGPVFTERHKFSDRKKKGYVVKFNVALAVIAFLNGFFYYTGRSDCITILAMTLTTNLISNITKRIQNKKNSMCV
ncbi:MAG: accessory gene regulator B family protein [Lachnospiraceae bacterium]|nr:accessory gene regulator B family protein [Lachnospiraceae bacterium]